MTGQLEAIHIAHPKGDPVTSLHNAVVVAGSGLQGDRYAAGTPKAGRHVTLIEAEEIDRFNTEYRRNVTAHQTRRNLVTRAIRLTELVGQIFRVGSVRLRGIELCEPCSVLGHNLSDSDMAPKEIVRAWVHRAGLCAEVVTGGIISVGDPIIALDQFTGLGG